MFNFLNKKEKIEVFAPVEGFVIDITKVKDEVFSTKMLGDGFAIEPTGNTVVAPCDGKITLLADTKHAIALETGGVEMLIHIGLDTVELNGEGFTSFIEGGEVVKKGDKLISFDKEVIKSKNKALTTMLVITNMDDAVESMEKKLEYGEAILTITAK